MKFANALAIPSIMPSGGFSAEALALFAAMDVEPDDERKELYDAFISDMKAAGLWVTSDGIYLFAAHDAQAARVNIRNPGTNTFALVNTPTFTQDRGFTGNGTTSGLNGGPNGTLTAHYSLNSASQSVWCGTDATENVGDFGAVNNAIRAHAGAGGFVIRANNANGTAQTPSPNTAVGLTAWSRSDASGFDAYKNGAFVSSLVSASVSVSNGGMSVCFVGGGFSTKRIQACRCGSALTGAAQALAEYNAFNAWMTAVGAA